MSSRSEKNVKQLKEKHQVILNDLLREEANRYCADCAAKGPRWASWNLGVFLCIRCAGIHRNLGVHISRVKSVNLDSWTAPQIESIQSWGNGRAKQYYECYLPTDFVRPQGDSAMETLIRNKYERKLYIRKGGEPPKNNAKDQPKQQESRKEPEKKQEKLVKIASERKMPPKTSPQQAQSTSIARPTASTTQQPTSSKPPAASVDLLGIDTSPQPSQSSAADQNDDEFSLFMAAAPVNNQPSQNQAVSAPLQTSQAQTSNPSESLNSLMLEEAVTTKANTKDSIMSLYQSGNQQQKQMFGVPGGVYMSQQQQQQQRGNAFPMQGNSQQMMPSTQQSMPMPNQGMRPNQQQQQQQTMNQYQMMMNAQQAGMKQNFMPTNQNSFSGNMMNGKMNMNPNGMQQAQPGMSNMMSMQAQMQNMNLARSNQPNQFYNTNNQMPQMQNNQQFQAANFQSNMGQNVMANSYGQSRPMMPSQQPILVNGQSSGMGFANTNIGMSQNMGHTLNNQLWK